MELDDLHVLLHIADQGSMRAAAQRLGVERSALRRQLARVEAAFGTRLVERDGRGMRLTPAGQLAAERARVLLTEASAMVEQVQVLDGQATGRARLLLPIGLPVFVRLEALALMRARHPELAVDAREVEDPLRASHLPFDLMVHFGPPPEGMDLISHVLGRPARRLYGAQERLACGGGPSTVAALAEHPLLMWRCPGQPEDRLPLRGAGSLPVRPWLISSDATLVLEAARRGLGLALLPETFVQALGPEPGLEAALPEEVGDTLVFRISSQRPSRVDPRVRALLRNLRDVLRARAPGAAPKLAPALTPENAPAQGSAGRRRRRRA